MNRRFVAGLCLGVAFGATVGLGLHSASAAECKPVTIFKAGLGYVDSCTLEQRSPYADLPVKTPAPALQVVVVHEVVYVQAPAPAPKKSKIPVPYPYVAPAQNCYPLNLSLGRCPLPGEKWVTNSATGQIYHGTSVVPPYSDQTVTP